MYSLPCFLLKWRAYEFVLTSEVTSFANDLSALCYALHYDLGILEGETMIFVCHFRRDADSRGLILKSSWEIVIENLSKKIASVKTP